MTIRETDDLPLFSQGQIAEKKVKSRNKVLRVLDDKFWHSTAEMVERAGHRFSTGVDELRKRGYSIETRPANGACEYRLVGYTKRVRVPKTFRELYVSTPHWRKIRAERLEFDSHTCCMCHGKRDNCGRLEVHHWRYDLFAERIDDLMTLCQLCHRDLHSHDEIRIAFPKFVPTWMLDRVGINTQRAANA